MSEADKMFEELGYKKQIQNKNILIYDGNGKDVCFVLNTKEISIGIGFERNYFNMQELKAINKKVEELGWK